MSSERKRREEKNEEHRVRETNDFASEKGAGDGRCRAARETSSVFGEYQKIDEQNECARNRVVKYV